MGIVSSDSLFVPLVLSPTYAIDEPKELNVKSLPR
jgi:hypothetical protein